MKQALIIALVALAVLGGWLLISSTQRAGVAGREQVYAQEMQQLRSFFEDKPTQPHLPDHLYVLLEDGTGLFLHFDKPVGRDSQILWIGTLVPGKFCKADQERVAKAYGPGFVHFHQKFIPGSDPNAGHGGKGGEEGYWYRHIAVVNIPKGDMMAGTGVPWGPVKPGIDMNFMPTPAPQC